MVVSLGITHYNVIATPCTSRNHVPLSVYQWFKSTLPQLVPLYSYFFILPIAEEKSINPGDVIVVEGIG